MRGGVRERHARGAPSGTRGVPRAAREACPERHARRTACTVSVRPRPPTKQMGLFSSLLASAARWSLDALDALHPLGPLDSFDALDPLGPLGALDTLDPLGSLNPLHPLGTLDALGTLDTLDALGSF